MESRWRQTFNNTCVACSYKDPVRYTLSPAKGKEVNVLTVPDIDKDARKREVQGGRDVGRGRGGGQRKKNILDVGNKRAPWLRL